MDGRWARSIAGCGHAWVGEGSDYGEEGVLFLGVGKVPDTTI